MSNLKSDELKSASFFSAHISSTQFNIRVHFVDYQFLLLIFNRKSNFRMFEFTGRNGSFVVDCFWAVFVYVNESETPQHSTKFKWDPIINNQAIVELINTQPILNLIECDKLIWLDESQPFEQASSVYDFRLPWYHITWYESFIATESYHCHY